MEYDPERITFFAKTDARGQQTPFGIKAKDRTRHVYVIGKTGMGKSTLLENMAVQDIKNGEGMAFIDPHGQTAETLLDYIPEERKKDVLYFAPFDMENPVSFNVMEDVGADKRHLVVSGLMSTFKKIWVDAWSARMEYILSNTLLALLEYPDSTLLGVNRMLSDKVYRKKVIDNITDPAVKSFWVDEFLKYNERYMQEAGDAIKNKTGQFTANPLIRNIIGQPKSSFDLRQLMDERKIIIVNLSKGLIGETNANLLGSMFITRIYLSAMSRAEMSPTELAKMSNFYFYVDEFQSFANEAFANILSEARKYKLNLTIAHQYIEQMEEEVRNAVFGNVGTTISFRVGPFDAEVLETIFQPKFYAVDICNLGFAQVYLSLMIDGIGSQPFSAVTLPPIQPEGVSCKDMVIHESRLQYTKPRAAVEQAITDWHGTDDNKQSGNQKPSPQKPGGNNSHNNGSKPNYSNNSNHTNNRTPQNDKKPVPRRDEQASRPPREDRERPKPTHKERVVFEKPKSKEKDLSELRSILKGMIADKKPEIKDEKMTTPAKEVFSQSKPENKQRLLEKKIPPKLKHDKLEQKSDQEKSVDKKPKLAQNHNQDSAQKSEKKSSDLKSALEGALADLNIGKAKPTKSEVAKENDLHKNSQDKKQPNAQDINTINTAKNNNNSHNTRVKRSLEQRKENHKTAKEFDAKRLERMMRVTTSDKTPLK